MSLSPAPICVLDSKWAPTDNKVAEVCQISSFGIRESYHMDLLSYSYTISLMILGGVKVDVYFDESAEISM